MMRRVAWVVAAMMVGGTASAQEIGPQDVIAPAVQQEIAECLRQRGGANQRAVLTCFERPGVTEGARGLTRAIMENRNSGLPGMLVGFYETGRVDVAEIFFPGLANTNEQMALVNATDGPHLAAELNFTRNPADTPSTRAIRARYPQAFESGRVAVVAVRHLPGGGQRFVLADVVTNGCRACEPVATSLRYFDFANGQYSGFMEIGWQPLRDITMAQSADRIRNGDMATIQDRLNRMGYDAGFVDGAAGPRTRAALAAFRQDYCLPEDGRISDAFVSYLTQESAEFLVPPCAPGASAQPGPALPFPDGVYAADPRLCPPVPLAVQAELGDRAYGQVVTMENGTWSWGESVCDIVRSQDVGAALRLDLNCLSDGSTHQTAFLLDAVRPTGFAYRGQSFQQCQAPVSALPLAAGTYAHDPRLCPGSTEQAPNEVVFEAGARPLVIDGSFFAWDHAACEITSAHQAGSSWSLDLSCHGENRVFQSSQVIRILSPTTVSFDGFVREWCGPPPEVFTQEIGSNNELPVDLEEGVYAFDPAGCPDMDGARRTDRQQIAANLRVTLRDGVFSRGEQTCPISRFSQTSEHSFLQMDCLMNGAQSIFQFEMWPQNRESFSHGENTYRLCTTSDAADEASTVLTEIPVFPGIGALLGADTDAQAADAVEALNQCHQRAALPSALNDQDARITVVVQLGPEGSMTGMPDLVSPTDPDATTRRIYIALMATLDLCAPERAGDLPDGAVADRMPLANFANARVVIVFDGQRVVSVNHVGSQPAPSTRQTELQGRAWNTATETSMSRLNLSRQDIRDIQARLFVLSFDPNGIDGAAGRGTRAAIAAWQQSRGIPETGYLDGDQLSTLRLQSAAALEAWLLNPDNQRRYEPPPPVPITAAVVNGRWSYTSTCGRNSRMPGRTITGEMQIAYSGGSGFSGAISNSQGLRGSLSGTVRGRQLSGSARWGLLIGSTSFQATISDDARTASGRDSLGCSFRARRR